MPEAMPTRSQTQPQKMGVGRSILNIIFGILCLTAGITTLALALNKLLGPLWMLLGPGLIMYGLYHVVKGVKRREPTSAGPETGNLNWIDKQIANMSILGLLLCSFVPLAFPVAWIGLVLCRHPKARKRAWIMVAVQAILVLLVPLLGLWPAGKRTGSLDKPGPVAKTEKELPPEPDKYITNSIGMKLVYIPAGDFMMGSLETEAGRAVDEGPRHKVKISNSFYTGVYEVKQSEYEKVMGQNPSYWKDGPDSPVETVNWDNVMEFCKKLSDRPEEKKAGRSYRLPTKAEWEYCCRAGSQRAYSFGEDPLPLDQYGWYVKNSGGKTHPVGRLKPNAWGLYDMHGNVWEWCGDYENKLMKDPQGAHAGDRRVLRGGSWDSDAAYCRAAFRLHNALGLPLPHVGFRVVCVVAGGGR